MSVLVVRSTGKSFFTYLPGTDGGDDILLAPGMSVAISGHELLRSDALREVLREMIDAGLLTTDPPPQMTIH